MIGYEWDGGHPLSAIADDHNCSIRDREPHCLLRPIYINAVEVGYAHLVGDEEYIYDEGRRLSVRGVALALWYFICRGHQAVGILPYCFKKYADKSDDWNSLMELYRMNLIEFTPGFGPEKYSEVNRILAYRARKMGGCMVARSQMHSVVEDNPILDKTVERRLLMPSFNGDDIIFPIDGPLGRSGITYRQTVVCKLNEVDWARVAVGQMILKDQRIWLRRLSTLFPDNGYRWNIMAHMVTLHQSNVILTDPPEGYPPVDRTVHRIHPPETNPVENPGFSLQRYKKGAQQKTRYSPFIYEHYPQLGSPTAQQKDYEALFFPTYVTKARIKHMKIVEKELELEYLEKRESDESEFECECCSPSKKKHTKKRRTRNSNECPECGEVICMCAEFEKDSVEGMSDAIEEMIKEKERDRIGGISSIYRFKSNSPEKSVKPKRKKSLEAEEKTNTMSDTMKPDELDCIGGANSIYRFKTQNTSGDEAKMEELLSDEEEQKSEEQKSEKRRKKKPKRKKVNDQEQWTKYRLEFDKYWKMTSNGQKAGSDDMFEYLDKKAAELRIKGDPECKIIEHLCRQQRRRRERRKREKDPCDKDDA
uniref:RNase_Zc3h12a domain-containing protein n=1 Tax=Steinernema glaseri TaxID=37863 RepID=A0A1I7YGF5_9BILA